MNNQLDIDAVRKHLLPALETTVYATLKQALDELENARSEALRGENLARYYHNKLIERDQHIIELKKEKLQAKDDGYENGWDDASRDGER